jgi:asparagine synthase (glutamine-hydrolysing)
VLHKPEEQLAGAAIEFPYNSPTTKEAYFLGLFLISTIQTTAAQTVRKWIPKWQENLDPRKSKFTHADTEIAKQELANLTYYFCLDIALQLKRIFCLI